ncbi:MAG: 30S ribosomal protein S3 [Methanophagales archaeon]|nr:30S ribosomal protein S3 [Methanophagales archaeon]
MDEYFQKELERAGYGGMDIKRTPMGTQITVHVEKPGMIIGKNGKRIKKVTDEITKKQELDNPQIDVQPIAAPELSAQLMSNRLAKLIERGWHFRRAGRSTLQRIMGAGALGCEITMSGKLRGPRGRVEKMVEGYIKHCGSVAEEIVDKGYSIAQKKTGVIGVVVWIVAPDANIPDSFRMNVVKEAGVEKAKVEDVKAEEVKVEEVKAEEAELKVEGAEEKEEE